MHAGQEVAGMPPYDAAAHTIADAQAILEETLGSLSDFRRQQQRLALSGAASTSSSGGSSACDRGGGGGGGDVAATPAIYVPTHMQPSPAHETLPCVYVVRWEDGWFYVGQTMRIHERMQEHRRRRGMQNMEMVYVALRQGDAVSRENAARHLEALVIRRMGDQRLPLWSTHDAAMPGGSRM